MVGKLRDTKTSRSCQPSSSSARGDALARVARVPINFPRHVHHDCQHDEERDRAHKQRVILLSQRDVKKEVNAGESRTDHKVRTPPPRKKLQYHVISTVEATAAVR